MIKSKHKRRTIPVYQSLEEFNILVPRSKRVNNSIQRTISYQKYSYQFKRYMKNDLSKTRKYKIKKFMIG